MTQLEKWFGSLLDSTLPRCDIGPAGFQMWKRGTTDKFANLLWNLDLTDYDADIQVILLKLRKKLLAERVASFEEIVRLGHQLCTLAAPERLPRYEHVLGA